MFSWGLLICLVGYKDPKMYVTFFWVSETYIGPVRAGGVVAGFPKPAF